MVTRFLTVDPTPTSSEKRSVRLPSNNMTATDNETRGNSRSPNRSSGLSRPKTGPASMPNSNRKKMAGRRTHQATKRATAARKPIPAMIVSALICYFCQFYCAQTLTRIAQQCDNRYHSDVRVLTGMLIDQYR